MEGRRSCKFLRIRTLATTSRRTGKTGSHVKGKPKLIKSRPVNKSHDQKTGNTSDQSKNSSDAGVHSRGRSSSSGASGSSLSKRGKKEETAIKNDKGNVTELDPVRNVSPAVARVKARNSPSPNRRFKSNIMTRHSSNSPSFHTRGRSDSPAARRAISIKGSQDGRSKLIEKVKERVLIKPKHVMSSKSTDGATVRISRISSPEHKLLARGSLNGIPSTTDSKQATSSSPLFAKAQRNTSGTRTIKTSGIGAKSASAVTLRKDTSGLEIKKLVKGTNSPARDRPKSEVATKDTLTRNKNEKVFHKEVPKKTKDPKPVFSDTANLKTYSKHSKTEKKQGGKQEETPEVETVVYKGEQIKTYMRRRPKNMSPFRQRGWRRLTKYPGNRPTEDIDLDKELKIISHSPTPSPVPSSSDSSACQSRASTPEPVLKELRIVLEKLDMKDLAKLGKLSGKGLKKRSKSVGTLKLSKKKNDRRSLDPTSKSVRQDSLIKHQEINKGAETNTKMLQGNDKVQVAKPTQATSSPTIHKEDSDQRSSKERNSFAFLQSMNQKKDPPKNDPPKKDWKKNLMARKSLTGSSHLGSNSKTKGPELTHTKVQNKASPNKPTKGSLKPVKRVKIKKNKEEEIYTFGDEPTPKAISLSEQRRSSSEKNDEEKDSNTVVDRKKTGESKIEKDVSSPVRVAKDKIIGKSIDLSEEKVVKEHSMIKKSEPKVVKDLVPESSNERKTTKRKQVRTTTVALAVQDIRKINTGSKPSSPIIRQPFQDDHKEIKKNLDENSKNSFETSGKNEDNKDSKDKPSTCDVVVVLEVTDLKVKEKSQKLEKYLEPSEQKEVRKEVEIPSHNTEKAFSAESSNLVKKQKRTDDHNEPNESKTLSVKFDENKKIEKLDKGPQSKNQDSKLISEKEKEPLTENPILTESSVPSSGSVSDAVSQQEKPEDKSELREEESSSGSVVMKRIEVDQENKKEEKAPISDEDIDNKEKDSIVLTVSTDLQQSPAASTSIDDKKDEVTVLGKDSSQSIMELEGREKNLEDKVDHITEGQSNCLSNIPVEMAPDISMATTTEDRETSGEKNAKESAIPRITEIDLQAATEVTKLDNAQPTESESIIEEKELEKSEPVLMDSQESVATETKPDQTEDTTVVSIEMESENSIPTEIVPQQIETSATIDTKPSSSGHEEMNICQEDSIVEGEIESADNQKYENVDSKTETVEEEEVKNKEVTETEEMKQEVVETEDKESVSSDQPGDSNQKEVSKESGVASGELGLNEKEINERVKSNDAVDTVSSDDKRKDDETLVTKDETCEEKKETDILPEVAPEIPDNVQCEEINSTLVEESSTSVGVIDKDRTKEEKQTSDTVECKKDTEMDITAQEEDLPTDQSSPSALLQDSNDHSGDLSTTETNTDLDTVVQNEKKTEDNEKVPDENMSTEDNQIEQPPQSDKDTISEDVNVQKDIEPETHEPDVDTGSPSENLIKEQEEQKAMCEVEESCSNKTDERQRENLDSSEFKKDSSLKLLEENIEPTVEKATDDVLPEEEKEKLDSCEGGNKSSEEITEDSTDPIIDADNDIGTWDMAEVSDVGFENMENEMQQISIVVDTKSNEGKDDIINDQTKPIVIEHSPVIPVLERQMTNEPLEENPETRVLPVLEKQVFHEPSISKDQEEVIELPVLLKEVIKKQRDSSEPQPMAQGESSKQEEPTCDKPAIAQDASNKEQVFESESVIPDLEGAKEQEEKTKMEESPLVADNLEVTSSETKVDNVANVVTKDKKDEKTEFAHKKKETPSEKLKVNIKNLPEMKKTLAIVLTPVTEDKITSFAQPHGLPQKGKGDKKEADADVAECSNDQNSKIVIATSVVEKTENKIESDVIDTNKDSKDLNDIIVNKTQETVTKEETKEKNKSEQLVEKTRRELDEKTSESLEKKDKVEKVVLDIDKSVVEKDKIDSNKEISGSDLETKSNKVTDIISVSTQKLENVDNLEKIEKSENLDSVVKLKTDETEKKQILEHSENKKSDENLESSTELSDLQKENLGGSLETDSGPSEVSAEMIENQIKDNRETSLASETSKDNSSDPPLVKETIEPVRNKDEVQQEEKEAFVNKVDVQNEEMAKPVEESDVYDTPNVGDKEGAMQLEHSDESPFRGQKRKRGRMRELDALMRGELIPGRPMATMLRDRSRSPSIGLVLPGPESSQQGIMSQSQTNVLQRARGHFRGRARGRASFKHVIGAEKSFPFVRGQMFPNDDAGHHVVSVTKSHSEGNVPISNIKVIPRDQQEDPGMPTSLGGALRGSHFRGRGFRGRGGRKGRPPYKHLFKSDVEQSTSTNALLSHEHSTEDKGIDHNLTDHFTPESHETQMIESPSLSGRGRGTKRGRGSWRGRGTWRGKHFKPTNEILVSELNNDAAQAEGSGPDTAQSEVDKKSGLSAVVYKRFSHLRRKRSRGKVLSQSTWYRKHRKQKKKQMMLQAAAARVQDTETVEMNTTSEAQTNDTEGGATAIGILRVPPLILKRKPGRPASTSKRRRRFKCAYSKSNRQHWMTVKQGNQLPKTGINQGGTSTTDAGAKVPGLGASPEVGLTPLSVEIPQEDASKSPKGPRERIIPSPTKMTTRKKQNRLWHLFAKQSKPKEWKELTKEKKVKRKSKEGLVLYGNVKDLLKVCKPCTVTLVDIIKCLDLANQQTKELNASILHESFSSEDLSLDTSRNQLDVSMTMSDTSEITSPTVKTGKKKARKSIQPPPNVSDQVKTSTPKRPRIEDPDSTSTIDEKVSPLAKKAKTQEPRVDNERHFLSFLDPPSTSDGPNHQELVRKSYQRQDQSTTDSPMDTASGASIQPIQEKNQVPITLGAESLSQQKLPPKTVQVIQGQAFMEHDGVIEKGIEDGTTQAVTSVTYQYQCKQCDFSSNKTNMLDHIYSHFASKPLRCIVCGDPFSAKPDVVSHLKKDHSAYDFSGNAFGFKRVPVVKARTRSIISEENLKAMQQTLKMVKGPTSKPKKIESEGGALMSPVSSSPQSPSLSLEDSAAFLEKKNRPRIPIISQVDPKYPYFQCSHCTFATNNENIMIAHCDETHRLDRVFACTLCNVAATKIKSNMIKHIHQNHPGHKVQLRYQTDYTTHVMDSGKVSKSLQDIKDNSVPTEIATASIEDKSGKEKALTDNLGSSSPKVGIPCETEGIPRSDLGPTDDGSKPSLIPKAGSKKKSEKKETLRDTAPKVKPEADQTSGSDSETKKEPIKIILKIPKVKLSGDTANKSMNETSAGLASPQKISDMSKFLSTSSYEAAQSKLDKASEKPKKKALVSLIPKKGDLVTDSSASKPLEAAKGAPSEMETSHTPTEATRKGSLVTDSKPAETSKSGSLVTDSSTADTKIGNLVTDSSTAKAKTGSLVKGRSPARSPARMKSSSPARSPARMKEIGSLVTDSSPAETNKPGSLVTDSSPMLTSEKVANDKPIESRKKGSLETDSSAIEPHAGGDLGTTTEVMETESGPIVSANADETNPDQGQLVTDGAIAKPASADGVPKESTPVPKAKAKSPEISKIPSPVTAPEDANVTPSPSMPKSDPIPEPRDKTPPIVQKESVTKNIEKPVKSVGSPKVVESPKLPVTQDATQPTVLLIVSSQGASKQTPGLPISSNPGESQKVYAFVQNPTKPSSNVEILKQLSLPQSRPSTPTQSKTTATTSASSNKRVATPIASSPKVSTPPTTDSSATPARSQAAQPTNDGMTVVQHTELVAGLQKGYSSFSSSNVFTLKDNSSIVPVTSHAKGSVQATKEFSSSGKASPKVTTSKKRPPTPKNDDGVLDLSCKPPPPAKAPSPKVAPPTEPTPKTVPAKSQPEASPVQGPSEVQTAEISSTCMDSEKSSDAGIEEAMQIQPPVEKRKRVLGPRKRSQTARKSSTHTGQTTAQMQRFEQGAVKTNQIKSVTMVTPEDYRDVEMSISKQAESVLFSMEDANITDSEKTLRRAKRAKTSASAYESGEESGGELVIDESADGSDIDDSLGLKIVAVESLAPSAALKSPSGIKPARTESETNQSIIYKCNFCHFYGETNSEMAVHVGSIHREELWFSCPYCPYGSRGAWHTMSNHIERKHGKLRKKECRVIDQERYFKEVPVSKLKYKDTKGVVIIEPDENYGMMPTLGPSAMHSPIIIDNEPESILVRGHGAQQTMECEPIRDSQQGHRLMIPPSNKPAQPQNINTGASVNLTPRPGVICVEPPKPQSVRPGKREISPARIDPVKAKAMKQKISAVIQNKTSVANQPQNTTQQVAVTAANVQQATVQFINSPITLQQPGIFLIPTTAQNIYMAQGNQPGVINQNQIITASQFAPILQAPMEKPPATQTSFVVTQAPRLQTPARPVIRPPPLIHSSALVATAANSRKRMQTPPTLHRAPIIARVQAQPARPRMTPPQIVPQPKKASNVTPRPSPSSTPKAPEPEQTAAFDLSVKKSTSSIAPKKAPLPSVSPARSLPSNQDTSSYDVFKVKPKQAPVQTQQPQVVKSSPLADPGSFGLYYSEAAVRGPSKPVQRVPPPNIGIPGQIAAQFNLGPRPVSRPQVNTPKPVVPPTQVRTYKCPYCPFHSDPDALHNHILSHAPNIDWVCPYCPTECKMKKQELGSHIQTKHAGCRVVYIPYGVPIDI